MKQYKFIVINTQSEKNNGKEYPLNRALSLLSNLTFNHLKSKGKCGGKAVCGQCRIQITQETKSCNTPSAEEKIHFSQQELQDGWRLACQTFCLRDISLYIPH